MTQNKKCGATFTPKLTTNPPKPTTKPAMTSEEPIDVVTKKADTKKPDDCANFTDEIQKNGRRETNTEEQRQKRSHELMRLVYELPEEIKKPEINENNNMLKENPPITIVEITEQNGCETELESARQCDNDVYLKIDGSSPEDLGNKVVLDVLATNELIMTCSDEFKEVIDRSTPEDVSDEDLLELKKLLESKPRVLDRYIRECASSDEVNRLHSLTSSGPLSPRPRHEARSTSMTSDLIQLWLASSPVKVSDNYRDLV